MARKIHLRLETPIVLMSWTGGHMPVGLTSEEKKLANLILYISSKYMTNKKFGLTKLNKVLFFADFLSYRQRAKAVTGLEYFKIEHGPAPRSMKKVIAYLIDHEHIVIREEATFQGIQKRVIPLTNADLDQFSGEDISLVDDVIALLWDKSAEEVSELSHRYIVGWNGFDYKQTIPYEWTFARVTVEDDIPEDAIRKAREVAKRYSGFSNPPAKERAGSNPHRKRVQRVIRQTAQSR
jgi:hypothetical protein